MAAALAAACTMSDSATAAAGGTVGDEPVAAITANPDVLSLDGSSQSLVDGRSARRQRPAGRNVPLRVEILADGQIVDFGTISARTLVTGSNGRATSPTPRRRLSSGDDSRSATQRDADRDGSRPHTFDGSSRSGWCRPASSASRRPRASRSFPQTPAAFTDVRFDGSTSTPGSARRLPATCGISATARAGPA